MKITGTAIKLGVFSLVLLLFTAIIIVVFGQMRFDRTTGYSAIFSNASGLRAGQFVRASGVEVGKVSKVELIDGGSQGQGRLQRGPLAAAVRRAPPPPIRYLNLIGDRYMELKRGDSDKRLPAGGTIPLERTEPALDLDALIGGFRPVFRALDPDKVNNIAQSIITIFQGQGGTINDILDQTASLTSALADRDQAIGEVIRNLNTVLDTTVKHQQQFDETLQNFEQAHHRAEEPRGSDRELGRRHQRRGGHDRRSAGRQPPAAAEHRRPSRGHPAAAGGSEGSSSTTSSSGCRRRSRSSAGPAASTATSSTSTPAISRSEAQRACSRAARSARSSSSASRRVGARRNEDTRGFEPRPKRVDGHHHPAHRHRCGAELRQRADAVRDADLLRAVLRHRRHQQRATRCASPAWTSAGCDRMEIDGDKVVIGYSLGGTQIGTESRAAIRTDTILGRRNIEIEPRGSKALRANGFLPLGPDHHAVPDLRRVLRCDQGVVRLGHPDGEAVAERVVGDHRPDLSAPERRARRCRAVLRHHRQARRPDQATAGQRQQDRRHPRQPQRADQPSCWSTRSRCSRRSTNASTRSACCSSGWAPSPNR